MSFWCCYCWLWTYFTPVSSVSIVDFEQLNNHVVKTLKLGKQCIQSIETSETELLAPPTNSRTALELWPRCLLLIYTTVRASQLFVSPIFWHEVVHPFSQKLFVSILTMTKLKIMKFFVYLFYYCYHYY